MSAGFVLLTNWYQESSQERKAELVEVLQQNLNHPEIAQIVLFSDPPHDELPPVDLMKIRIVPRDRRTTFEELLAFANNSLPMGQVVIIANADIYFDASLARLKDVSLANRLLALTRRDVARSGQNPRLYRHPLFWQAFCQDAWIFQTPTPTIKAPFSPGIPGCDGRMAFLAQEAGMEVYNPCLSLSAMHLHLVEKRNYQGKDLLHGEYLALFETDLEKIENREAPAGIPFSIGSWNDLAIAYHVIGAGFRLARSQSGDWISSYSPRPEPPNDDVAS